MRNPFFTNAPLPLHGFPSSYLLVARRSSESLKRMQHLCFFHSLILPHRSRHSPGSLDAMLPSWAHVERNGWSAQTLLSSVCCWSLLAVYIHALPFSACATAVPSSPKSSFTPEPSREAYIEQCFPIVPYLFLDKALEYKTHVTIGNQRLSSSAYFLVGKR